MSKGTHPDTERLQGYADATIPEGDRAVVESHLQSCSRCTAEVEEWRSLFTVLSALPRLAPRPGFADRVLAGVKLPVAAPVRAPWLSRAGALAARMAPRTSAGWGLAAAFATAPLLIITALGYWLFTNEYLSPATVWAFASERATSDLQDLGAAVLGALVQSDLSIAALRVLQRVLDTAGASGLGVLVLGAALMITISIWILYKNLFRTPTRESSYVSYSF